jgi:hypothetical protein
LDELSIYGSHNGLEKFAIMRALTHESGSMMALLKRAMVDAPSYTGDKGSHCGAFRILGDPLPFNGPVKAA